MVRGRDRFVAGTGDDRISGWVAESGREVVLVHGGPGIGYEYLDGLATELDGYRVASYQQRGLAPSSETGPFAVADHVADLIRVLDHLGWDRAVLVGHSWGGHLALHAAVAIPDRITGIVAVDPLGGVGDGGMAEFASELWSRLSPQVAARAEELDRNSSNDPEEAQAAALESLRLAWPAYFSSLDAAPTPPALRMNALGYRETFASVTVELPTLERALTSIRVPTGFVCGMKSPMPQTASTDTAARIPGAWVDLVEGAGHFVWLEAPGRVAAAVERVLMTP